MAASRHAEFLGDMPPLNAARRRMPDRRQVSLRWLSGAVLAGLVSVYLMGTALFAALDGREKLTIRSRNDPKQKMGTLSGGNQQKVLLARWLERQSNALVLIEPTRGVDVGAREDIYRSLRQLAAQGQAVLVITSDYEEVVQVADRAYVMARGRMAAQLNGEEITTSRLLAAAGG